MSTVLKNDSWMDDDSNSNKKACTSLKEALQLAETSPCNKGVTFESAKLVLSRLEGFRPAAVVYVSRLPRKMWDSEAQVAAGVELSESQCIIFRELSKFGDHQCCRKIDGDFIIPSELLKIVVPLMEKFPAHKVKKLSQISSYIEYMLPRVDVNFRGDPGSPSMDDWEKYCTWMDQLTAKLPLLYAILDPPYLMIRGAAGVAPPAAAIAALGAIPVNPANPQTGMALSTAPVQVLDGNGNHTIDGLYRFANRTEAGNARMALVTWSNITGGGPLEFLRFATDANGLEWI